MNSGEWIICFHGRGHADTFDPMLWCDICGLSCPEENPGAKFHFCRRHNAKNINSFMAGDLSGYFERESQLKFLLD